MDEKLHRRRWLTWLHRIGYVTTALIVVQLLAIGYFGTRGWIEDREMRAAKIADTRTHEGPLQPTDDRWVRGSAIHLLGKLPPLGALNGDGIRFVAMPSFNSSHFAVAITLPDPTADEAQGVLSTFAQHDKYAPLGERQFRMPATAYRSLAARLDDLTDGWPGHSVVCLDGTPVAFERVRGSRITSGSGNCHSHYDQVSELMLDHLLRFAPGEELPTGGWWHSHDKPGG
jgi:hypothetical protein